MLLTSLKAALEAPSVAFAARAPARVQPRAAFLMGINAPVSCHTKDNSEYSLSAATAASVLVSIPHPHCALCLESALAVNNAFIQADSIAKLLVNV